MSEISVLIANDQPIVRHGIALLLQEQTGIKVLGEAGNGAETIEMVQRLRPDVVLMDTEMPRSLLKTTKPIAEIPPVVSALVLPHSPTNGT